MTKHNSQTLSLLKSTLQKEEVVVLQLKKWGEIERENQELRAAVEAILSGELALRKGQTRSFGKFLKSAFPRYAKNL